MELRPRATSQTSSCQDKEQEESEYQYVVLPEGTVVRGLHWKEVPMAARAPAPDSLLSDALACEDRTVYVRGFNAGVTPVFAGEMLIEWAWKNNWYMTSWWAMKSKHPHYLDLITMWVTFGTLTHTNGASYALQQPQPPDSPLYLWQDNYKWFVDQTTRVPRPNQLVAAPWK